MRWLRHLTLKYLGDATDYLVLRRQRRYSEWLTIPRDIRLQMNLK